MAKKRGTESAEARTNIIIQLTEDMEIDADALGDLIIKNMRRRKLPPDEIDEFIRALLTTEG
ncbi:unnamed protein product, partial [marine sediment metagenome]